MSYSRFRFLSSEISFWVDQGWRGFGDKILGVSKRKDWSSRLAWGIFSKGRDRESPCSYRKFKICVAPPAESQEQTVTLSPKRLRQHHSTHTHTQYKHYTLKRIFLSSSKAEFQMLACFPDLVHVLLRKILLLMQLYLPL